MADKRALTRDDLTSRAHSIEEVEVEKLGGGGIVYVKPLSVRDGFAFWDAGEEIDPDDPIENRERAIDAVIKGVVDEDGNRKLDDEHRDVVLDWPINDFNKISSAIMGVSALTPEAEEQIEGN